jgi:hypothetical protein
LCFHFDSFFEIPLVVALPVNYRIVFQNIGSPSNAADEMSMCTV